MKALLNRLITNWKSTLVAVILGVCTFMVAMHRMSVTEFVTVMGSVGALYGLLKKDSDI